MSFEIGSIVEGKVVRIKPFGAIVLIGDNIQGLVHISHISDSFVQDINNHIAIGDVVNVKVLSIDSSNNRLALSIKEASKSQSTPSPAPAKPVIDTPNDPNQTFEDKFKEWLKVSNERQAGINKRNKRR
ncbi:MAG: S1 RNA-binding domain-containing protein [Defluviitaleaceae bacterium]|nr:S1 RNA-binding domain-containing protein [Defluviitaleaceae bacterium]